MPKKAIKVVTFGGGSGQPVLLKALKDIPDLEITAIVNMFDNGGSTGRLCAKLDVLPSADVYRCIAALCPDERVDELMRLRFNGEGSLKGHTLGNLLMTQIDELCPDYLEAVSELSDLLNINGTVLPVTTEKSCLFAEYRDGHIIEGEHSINEPGQLNEVQIDRLYLKPHVRALPEVIEAINRADYIIASPGDLFTSVLANAVVGDVPVAIRDSAANFILVANLMTKYGQTTNMGVSDLVDEFEKYCLRRPDMVLVNKSQIPVPVLQKYRRAGEKQIKDDLNDDNIKKIKADLLDKSEVQAVAGDLLQRSLIKHDHQKLQKILATILR